MMVTTARSPTRQLRLDLDPEKADLPTHHARQQAAATMAADASLQQEL